LLYIILRFHVGYFDLNDELVIDKKKIQEKYLKGWFLFDVLVSLPFNYSPWLEFEG